MTLETLEAAYSETARLGAGLIILMVVNIVMGAVNSLFESEFDVRKLMKGIGKSIVLIMCFCAAYVAGLINADTLSIDLGGDEPVDIIGAMHALLLAGYFMYAKQVVGKMGSIIGVDAKLPQTARTPEPPDEPPAEPDDCWYGFSDEDEGEYE